MTPGAPPAAPAVRTAPIRTAPIVSTLQRGADEPGSNGPERGLLCVEIHDVAPATWPACSRIIDALRTVADVPCTLLVVPHFHGGTLADRDPAFRRAIDDRLAQGDEVALHGYYHLDDAPPPRTPRAWVERRVMTRAEGEFAALDEAQARERIERGLGLMQRAGWPVQGFVPPAWLLSPASRHVLAEYPFAYTATRRALHRLPAWKSETTMTIAYSPDAAWRRSLSRASTRWELATRRHAPVARLAIHPLDASYPAVLEAWKALTETLLCSRQALTQRDALAACA